MVGRVKKGAGWSDKRNSYCMYYGERPFKAIPKSFQILSLICMDVLVLGWACAAAF